MPEGSAIRVKGMSWLGVATDDYTASLRFFTQVLGLEVAASEEGRALLRIADGQLLELFGREGRGKALTNPPVVAFEVGDVAAAAQNLVRHGIELVGEHGAWDGFEWQYFRSPDGHVFAIKKTPPKWAEPGDE